MPPLLDWLRGEWTISGQAAPRFLWLATYGLILLLFWSVFAVWKKVWQHHRRRKIEEATRPAGYRPSPWR
jgi:hypothetical protein